MKSRARVGWSVLMVSALSAAVAACAPSTDSESEEIGDDDGSEGSAPLGAGRTGARITDDHPDRTVGRLTDGVSDRGGARNQGSGSPDGYATIRGRFIDENDWWFDGKVPGATIEAYEGGSVVGGGTTDGDGYYLFSGPFFGKQVRLVATPPQTARCKHGAQAVYVVADTAIKVVDFKDECRF